MWNNKASGPSDVNLSSDSDSDPMSTDWNRELIYAICQGIGETETDPEEYRLHRIKTCLDERADINSTHGKNSDTILHTAIKKNYQRIIELLVERGAKTDICNKKGYTAVTLTEKLDNHAVMNILKGPDYHQSRRLINQSHIVNQFRAIDDQVASTSRETRFPCRGMSPTQDLDSEGVTPKSKRKSTANCEDIANVKKQRLELREAPLSESHLGSVDEDNTENITPCARRHPDEDEEEIVHNQTSRLEREPTYIAGGLKSSFHGVVYQLKHLGYTLLLAMRPKREISFLLSTERVDVGKFDDLVLEFAGSVLFLQLKHSRNELKQIGAHDLLEKEDGDFFIPKYFVSWRDIKKSPIFGDRVSKNVVLGTNISINLEGLRNTEISCEEVTKPVGCLEMIGTKEETTCYKFTSNVQSNRRLYEKLKETSDVHTLARELVEHVLQRKKITLVGMFKQYHTALGEQVIDIRNKTFSRNFIKNQNLSPKAKHFRQIFYIEFSKLKNRLSKRTLSEDVIWKEVEDSSLELSKNFGEKFELPPAPQLNDISLFSLEFIKLLNNATQDKVVKISKNIYRKNAKKGSVERVVADNIDKLAGHVLITKSGKIKFRSQFLQGSMQSTGNLGDFKDLLKSHLGSKFDELHEFEFEINNFETCEEEELYTKTELPDREMAEADITEFLNSFVLATNLPNEVELGEMITNEIGDDSKFNLLDPDLIGRTFLTKIVDWFKEKGAKVGEGKYLSYKGGEIFLKDMENQINTLKSVGVTSVYWQELKEYGIDFECHNRALSAYLSENQPNFPSHRVLILMAPEEPLLTALRACQTLGRIKKYAKSDSFIFIRLRTLSLRGIRDQVVRAFHSEHSHHLLVIVCDSTSMKQSSQRLWWLLCKVVELVQNSRKTVVLIVKEEKGLATSLAKKFENFYTTDIQEDDIVKFDNLTKASQQILLGKEILTFQGHGGRISLGKLLGIEGLDNITADKLRDIAELIDSSTLVELIHNNDEIRIGGELEGLGEVADYYINRKIRRNVVIQSDILKDQRIPDLFAICCTDREIQEEQRQKTETFSTLQNMKNVIMLDSEHEEEQFGELCKKNLNCNIHWIREQTGKYIWKRTRGSITCLLKYKEVSANDCENDGTDGRYLNEQEFAAHDGPVIVSDTAGMGKSTMMTHLSVLMKRAGPGLLVLKIDLNRHTTALADVRTNSKYNLGVVESGVEFLVNELLDLRTNLERTIFKAVIKNNRNVALIFDGFDEISPTHESTVIELLGTLAKHRIKKLFVATRPHTSRSLEEILNTFSHEIQPFSAANQNDFLVKFWNSGLGLDDSDKTMQNRIRMYAQGLITRLSDSINDRMNKFTGIPLQTKLVAEIFQNIREGRLLNYDSCEKFKDSSDDQPRLPEKIDLIHLYELFVDMKFDNFFKKRGGNLADPGVIEGKKLCYDAFIDAHEKLALNMFLGADKVKEMVPSQGNRIQESNIVQERTGIITQFVNGKPHFGHRTYAEYFAAKFLFNRIKEGIQNPSVMKIFVVDIFLGQSCEMLCVFMNCLLSDERNEPFVDGSWTPYFLEYRGSKNRTIFHVAAIEGNSEILKLFLNCFTDCHHDLVALIDLKDEPGRTAVYWAADYGHFKELTLLVEVGGGKVDINTGMDLQTALHTAAAYGRLNIVTYLLRKKATVDSLTSANQTPLHLAARDGKLDVVIHLLEKGAGVNHQSDDGSTPLYEAVMYSRLNVVKHLIEKGAGVNYTDKYGRSPLHIAASNSKLDLMKCLLTKEATVDLPNRDGEIPLYMVAFRGHLEAVKYLIEKGADVNFQAKFGATPLHVAAMKGKFDVVNYLFDKGAVIDTIADELAMLLADPSLCVETDTLEYWCGRELFAPVLNLAACMSKIEVMKNWIDQTEGGVNCQSMDDGITPLHVAACLGRLDVVEYLLKNGAYIDPRAHDGSTPLYAAACTGKYEVVQCLLKNGAIVDSRTKYGDTPMNVACVNEKLDVVKYFLEIEANVDCENNAGRKTITVVPCNSKSDVIRETPTHLQDGT